MHQKNIIAAGKQLESANKAVIFVHGRGATAQDIIGLAGELNVDGYALLAPQATNFTWYPYSFMVPVKQNEPWLSSALQLLKDITHDINTKGIKDDHIYFAGFSQGACLTLEFVTRNARKWGGVAAFTGGLIGETLEVKNYRGLFENTPIFIGSSNPDPHVPVDRVKATTQILRSMGANVVEQVYNNMGHTIIQDEIDHANAHVFGKAVGGGLSLLAISI